MIAYLKLNQTAKVGYRGILAISVADLWMNCFKPL
jgi:hypothetical protein